MTFSTGVRLAIAAAALLFIAIMIGRGDGGPQDGDAAFGMVREGAPVDEADGPRGLDQQLARLHADLAVAPGQQAAWDGFARAMVELDRVSRAFEARAGAATDAAGERMRHALLFSVALGDIDAVLTPRQSVVLREGARSLGSAFLCSQIGSTAFGARGV
ncbi:hypothetical protein [Ancylobacter sp.]|uniref:hypothetical protein n=1 Tax=Ancylobacter sp. TaxID=1872567 RepID=UPI003D0C8109